MRKSNEFDVKMDASILDDPGRIKKSKSTILYTRCISEAHCLIRNNFARCYIKLAHE